MRVTHCVIKLDSLIRFISKGTIMFFPVWGKNCPSHFKAQAALNVLVFFPTYMYKVIRSIAKDIARNAMQKTARSMQAWLQLHTILPCLHSHPFSWNPAAGKKLNLRFNLIKAFPCFVERTSFLPAYRW